MAWKEGFYFDLNMGVMTHFCINFLFAYVAIWTAGYAVLKPAELTARNRVEIAKVVSIALLVGLA